MAPRSTRSKPASEPASTVAEPPAVQLERNEDEQQRLFILPRNTSSSSRIVSLPNPATMAPGRYFFCPNKGLFEFSKIAAPPNMPQSWLIAGQPKANSESDADVNRVPNKGHECADGDVSLQDGYVLENADLFVATPFDPIFLLHPLFKPLASGSKGTFRLGDDYIDTLAESSKELKLLLRQEVFQDLLLNRLRSVSETQDLGDDCLYKPDISSFIHELLRKGDRMTQPGLWPASMEEAFIRRQIEIPVVPDVHGNQQLPTPEQSMTESDLDSRDSQSQNTLAPASTDDAEQTRESNQSDAVTDPQQSQTPERIKELMRLRVALNYLLSSYIPSHLREYFNQLLSSNNTVDFEPLNEHLAKIQKARTEIQALRSISDNISRKRGAADDDEAAEARAEKKRRKEEEEKKKKAESRAVKMLKKVDTSGMKKMSSFFTKAPTAAKN